MSDLNFTAGIDRTQWKSDIDAIRRDLLGLNSTVQSETQKMDSSFRTLGAGIAGYFSGQALLGFTQKLINVRGEFQKTEIAFTTMLGSAEKSKVLMGQMIDLAAKTPFGLEDVTDGAKRLLAFQVPAEQVVDTLTRIGNVAAGLGVPMGQLIHVYGQVKAQGKLMTNDLYQFMNAGIPMTAELAKVMGVAENQVKDLISAGKVGFPEVQKVIANLTNEGGMFFNLMEAQSSSLSGQIANLEDNFTQMLNNIGQANEGILNEGIAELAWMVENYEKVIEAIKVLVAMYGAYRTALIVTSVAQKVAIANEGSLTVAQGARTLATMAANKATALLNATMFANPYAVATALIVGLTYALVKMAGQASYAEDAQDRLNKKLTEAGTSTAEQKAKIEALVTAIKSENITNERREVLLKQIKTLANGRLDQLTVEAILTGKATEAINGYISALDRQAKAKAYTDLMSENYKRIAEIDSRKKSTFGERVSSTFDAATYQDKNGNTTFSSVLEGLGKKSEDAIKDNEQKEKAALLAKNENIKKIVGKNAGDLADSYSQGGSKIAEGVGESESKVKKSKEKHEKELAEVFSKGSIADLEKRISEWNNALQRADTEKDVVKVRKTDKYGKEKETGETVTIAEAKKQVEELEKAKAEANKKIQRLSFDEQLAEDERQWNIRYQIAKQYGEDIAKAQFPNLKGDSYFDDLKSQYDALTKKIEDSKTDKSVIVSKTDIENATKIKTILDSLTGTKDSKTQYFDDLDEELAKLKTFAEKKALLDNKESELTPQQKDKGYIAEFANRKEANVKSWKETYDAILEEQKSYEEKSAELAKQYAEIKNSYEYKNGSDADRKKIDDSFSKKATDLFLENLQNSDSWLRMFSEMETVTTTELENFKALLVKKLKEAKTEAEKIKIGGFIRQIDDELRGRNPFDSLYKSFSKLVQKIKDGTVAAGDFIAVLKDLNGVKSEVNSLVDSFQAVSDALGLNIDTSGLKDTLNNIIGGVEGIGQAVSGFISGNPLDMVKGVMKAVSSIGQLFNGDKKKERSIKKQAADLKILETAYNNLAYAAEKAYGSQKYSAQTDVIKNLEQQKIALQGMINTESSKKKADKGKIAEWENQIQTINQSIDQMKTKIVEDVLQTSVVDAASKVGDALVDAFGRGESAVDSLNNAANDMIENLLKNQLNMMLQNRMQPILDDLLAATGMNADGTGSFNELTPEEIASFKAQVQAAGADMQGFLEAYSDIFGGLDANASSLEGAIKGVSEETASLIAGQMNAMRIVQAQMLENSNISIAVLRNSLLQLTQIEINTRFLRLIYLEVSKNKDDGSIRASGLI